MINSLVGIHRIEFKKVLKHFPKLFLNIVYIAASLVPRNRAIWLFSCWGGMNYSDNPKYIYRQLKTQDSLNIKSFFLVKNREKYLELLYQGVDVIDAYSIKGLLMQLRAGVVVFTHSVNNEYLSYLIAHRVKRIQTWHGIPIKKIGYDDENSTPKDVIQIWNKFFPYLSDHLDLVLAASSEDSKLYVSAFNVDANRVKITGYPRNDGLRNHVEKNIKLEVIYMPTYRGDINSEFNLFEKTNFNFFYYDNICNKLDINLSIKLHPIQIFKKNDLEIIKKCRNIHAIHDTRDIYEWLCKFDVLITDFSGVYFDFLITGKPIIMAPFKMNEYLLQDRSLYYTYEDICIQTPVHSWDELFNTLKDIKNGKVKNCKRYNQLQNRFHKNLDSLASKRAIEAIQSIL